MNSKLIKASLAGVAAIGLVAGGGTFANFSDTATKTAEVGAGTLELVLNGEQSATADENLRLIPNKAKYTDVYIASNSGESVPNANLYLTFTDLVDVEDGCNGNELADQQARFPGTDCNDTGLPGQFAQAVDVVAQSKPASSATECGSAGAYIDGAKKRLSALEDLPVLMPYTAAVPTIAPGQGVCVRIQYSLEGKNSKPSGIGNEVQGDSTDMTLKFDLEQAI